MSIGPWDFGGFDIVVLLILAISGILAFSRGFIREIVSIIALISGLIAALFLFGRFQGKVIEIIQPAWLANGALGIGAFFLAYLLVTFILRRAARKLRGRHPGLLDKLAGLGFGGLRGLLIASLFVVVFRTASKDETVPVWLEDTTFYSVLNPIATRMMNMPFAHLKSTAKDTIENGRERDPSKD